MTTRPAGPVPGRWALPLFALCLALAVVFSLVTGMNLGVFRPPRDRIVVAAHPVAGRGQPPQPPPLPTNRAPAEPDPPDKGGLSVGEADVQAARRRLIRWGVPHDDTAARALLGGGPGRKPAVRSAYYSLGRVLPASGDVGPLAGAAALARNRSYAGELIVTIATSDGVRRAANLARNCLLLGFEHFVTLAQLPSTCESLWSIMPEASCVHSSYLLDHPGLKRWHSHQTDSLVVLWALRWKLLADLTGLGYRVLSMDSDMSIRADPYPAFRSPELSAHHIISDAHAVGVGWTYAANVSQGRPAHWVIREVSRRIEALLDLEDPPRGRDGQVPGNALWEQYNWADAKASAFGGRVTFETVLAEFRTPAWGDLKLVGNVSSERLQWKDAATAGPNPGLEACDICESPPAPTRLVWNALRVPCDAGSLVPRNGTMWAFKGPVDTGPNGLPWYPVGGECPSPPQDVDTVVCPPPWLLSNYDAHAGGGWFDARPPQAMIFHTMGAPGHPSKQLLFRELGWWYFGPDAPHNERGGPDLQPESKLLAIAPWEPTRAPTRRGFQLLLHRLMAAAAASGRLPVVPRLPCDSPWIPTTADGAYYYNRPGGALAPNAPRYKGDVILFGPAKRPRCAFVLNDACLVDIALNQYDLELWLAVHPELAPSWWVAGEPGTAQAPTPPAEPESVIDALPLSAATGGAARLDALLAALAARANDTLLFISGLESLPLLTSSPRPEGGWGNPGASSPPPPPPITDGDGGAQGHSGSADDAGGEGAFGGVPSAEGLESLSPAARHRLGEMDRRCRLAMGYPCGC